MRYLLFSLLLALLSPDDALKLNDNGTLYDVELLCSGKPLKKGVTFIRNEAYERMGRCYGYANCTACRTCNYCEYCNSGGSCGVCSYGTPAPIYREKPIVRERPGYIPKSPIDVPRPLTPVPTMTEVRNDYAVSKGDFVNIRSLPTIHSEVLGKVNTGDRLDVISKSPYMQQVGQYGWGYWYKVKEDGMEGWIFGNLLDLDGLNPGSIDTENLEYRVIDASFINVRSKPSVRSKILFKLYTGDRITIIMRSDQISTVPGYGTNYWYLVAHEGFEGWVLVH
ncbi:MAG: SH3 domain-containing protein [Saprospiraceae bacterium]|nr:SH3 domain-containing protein [Saprospiraceae bacterium]